ncbi:aminotransferase class IV [Marinobacter sp.]|uniref:aminotransferase class IV n=1 Tax=Marinobacter sp. TaxID=50741 RepID=UPI0035621718
MITIVVPEHQPGEAGVAVSDRGLAYGDGLFETILIRCGQPQLLQAHCQRLLEGAARLGIPLREDELTPAVRRACALMDATTDRQVLKLLLTRGSGGRGYRPPAEPEPRLIISVTPAPPAPPESGVKAIISEIPLTVNPMLAGIKSLNRLEQVMASRSIPEDCYEALMCGDQGDLREGTRTGLLFRWQGQWWTPPRDRVAVRSIMVAHVERGLAREGIPLREGLLYPEQCWQPEFGGLLLLNSLIGAIPVQALNGRELPLPEQLATIVSLAKQPEEFR